MTNLLTSDILNSLKLVEKGLTRELYDYGYHPLHLFTNENIAGIMNNINLKNASILLPCASSDQIFNFLLCHPKHITSYDINELTPYLFELKKSSILELTRDEYLNFFYPSKNILTNKFLNSDTYQKVRKSLSRDAKIYWDSILQTFSSNRLKNSSLFLHTNYSKKIIQNINPYMEKSYYDELKDILRNFSLDFINSSIMDLHSLLKENYDFIYLSNIADYLDSKNVLNELANIAENLKRYLNNDGMIGIVYLYNYLDDYFYNSIYPLYNSGLRNKYFNESGYNYVEFPNALFQSTGNKERTLRRRDYDSILTYHKK